MTSVVPNLDDRALELVAKARVVAHPLRVRVLLELKTPPQNGRGRNHSLTNRQQTPKTLATTLGARLENLSYHVRELRQAGMIELVRTTPVRGALEHHYRLSDAGRRLIDSLEAL